MEDVILNIVYYLRLSHSIGSLLRLDAPIISIELAATINRALSSFSFLCVNILLLCAKFEEESYLWSVTTTFITVWIKNCHNYRSRSLSKAYCFGKNHKWSPKWPWKIQGQRVHIHVALEAVLARFNSTVGFPRYLFPCSAIMKLFHILIGIHVKYNVPC